MKAYEDYHRVLAAASYAAKKGNVAAAVKDFCDRCAVLGLELPADSRRFVQKWGTFWEQHRHVRGRSSSCGRHRKLSDEEAELLVADLMNWAGLGLKGPFKSLAQLKKVSARAKKILTAAKAADSTVISTLKMIEPKLAYKKLTVKQKLSNKQREERLRVARHHVRVRGKKLDTVVWIDAKTMYMTIKTRCGWVRVDDEIPFETTRPASKKQPITLRYYIGVCGRAGAVFLTFYTGTTGMPANRDPQRTYLVSSAYVQLRVLLGYCCCDGALDCCTPASAAAGGPARHQPHHLIVLLPGCCCKGAIPLHAVSQVGLSATVAVAASVQLDVVLLALHCNQHTGRLQQHQVPPVPPHIHPPTLVPNPALHCVCFSCKGCHSCEAVKYPVNFLFIPTPAPCTDAALQGQQPFAADGVIGRQTHVLAVAAGAPIHCLDAAIRRGCAGVTAAELGLEPG